MGFFGSGDKTTTTVNEQLGASDNGLLLAGSGQASATDQASSTAIDQQAGQGTIGGQGGYGNQNIGAGASQGNNIGGSLITGLTSADFSRAVADIANSFASVTGKVSDTPSATTPGGGSVGLSLSGLSDIGFGQAGTTSPTLNAATTSAPWIVAGIVAVVVAYLWKK